MVQREPLAKSLIALASLLWLNVAFWIAVPLITVVFLVVATCYVGIFALVVRRRRRIQWLIRRSISHYGAIVLKCAWPLVRVRYVDYGPDAKPPFVFVSNHRSTSDAYLMACLPFECIQVLNKWPSRIPVFGQIAAIAGYLRVREMPFDTFVRKGSKLLGEGASIIAFPEGTRSGSRKMGPFHGSAFRLAKQVGVNIVPLAITGNENIPMRKSMVLHPGQIVVSKLPAVTCEQYKDMSAYKLKALVRERIRQHLEVQST
jgi:1-acyl-sn-glycerol-3-phosphate acyltransferase